MPTLDEVSIQVSYAIETFVHSLESYFVVSQPFMSNRWRIRYYRIKAPVFLALRLIKEHFGKLKLPVEEAFVLRECQCRLYRLLIFLVSFTVIVVDDRSGVFLSDVLCSLDTEIFTYPYVQQAFEWGDGIVGSLVGLA